MPLGTILGAIAGPVLGGIFGDETERTQEVTRQAPAPRTGEGQRIWDEFMGTLFGPEGLQPTLRGQAEYLQPKVEEYTGILGDLMTGQGLGAGLLDPTTVTIGDEGGFSFIPRSHRETIGLLEQLAAKRLGTEAMYAPGYEDIKYMDYLRPLAMGTESLRYQIPTAVTESELEMPGPHVLTEIAAGAGIGKQLGEILGALFKKTP